jgi:hypothetical protein
MAHIFVIMENGVSRRQSEKLTATTLLARTCATALPA